MDFPTCSRIRHSALGFTLTELLMALAILAILLSVTMPSFRAMVLDSRQVTHTNQLLGTLAQARSEAIKRREWVGICKSADGQSCTSDGYWEQGWIAYVDRNRNRVRDADEELLYHQPANTHLRIRYRGYPAYSSNRYVIYYPNGASLGNGTFTFCDERGFAEARAIILAKTGRARAARLEPDGSPLDCSW